MLTLIKDLPITVAKKKVLKSISKYPQVKPAKSNNGFGIEAINNTVIKEYFST